MRAVLVKGADPLPDPRPVEEDSVGEAGLACRNGNSASAARGPVGAIACDARPSLDRGGVWGIV